MAMANWCLAMAVKVLLAREGAKTKGDSKMKTLATAVVVYALRTATGALFQITKVNWQVNAPFSDYHTHAWQENKNAGGEVYQRWAGQNVDPIISEKVATEST
jgi:hypothetical protein